MGEKYNQLALIIDADIHLSLSVKAIFQGEGYRRVEAISEGLAALDFLRDNTPSIILLDIASPVLRGREIVRFVRSEERFADTRMILLTETIKRTGGRTGSLANLVLVKPVDTQLLRHLIARY